MGASHHGEPSAAEPESSLAKAEDAKDKTFSELCALASWREKIRVRKPCRKIWVSRAKLQAYYYEVHEDLMIPASCASCAPLKMGLPPSFVLPAKRRKSGAFPLDGE